MTQPNPQPLTFVGVKMPPALAGAVKTTAAARGVTVSAMIRDALAKEIALLPENPARPA